MDTIAISLRKSRNITREQEYLKLRPTLTPVHIPTPLTGEQKELLEVSKIK